MRRTREGTRIGELLLTKKEASDVREVSTEIIMSSWSEDDIIDRCGQAVAYPADDDQVFCHIAVKDRVIDVPDQAFLIKIMRLL